VRVVAVAWLFVACTDDGEPARPSPARDASVDPAQDAAHVDAGVDARVDCEVDRADDGLATHLRCAGLYDDFGEKRVAADTRSFAPSFAFWSDEAVKERWVRIPEGTTIDISTFDEWKFPVGTRFWKEFRLEGRRLETRLFEKLASGWSHAIYRWNDDETEATRSRGGELVEIAGRTPYEIPREIDCDYCHRGRVEPVLGFQAVSLGLDGASGLTLSVLAEEGLFSSPPPSTTLALPNDETGLFPPAVGWLHANCGHCHNDRPSAGAAGSSLRMLVTASELLGQDAGPVDAHDLAVYRTGVCKVSERDAPFGGSYLFIAGGSPSTSLAALLLGSRAPVGQESIVTQMPPIVTHMVDFDGKTDVDAWISALPTCP
jgi:hypothetical protein